MVKKKGKRNKSKDDSNDSGKHQHQSMEASIRPVHVHNIKIRCVEHQSKDKYGLLISKGYVLWCRFESEGKVDQATSSHRSYVSRTYSSNNKIVGSLSRPFLQKLLEATVVVDKDESNSGSIGKLTIPITPKSKLNNQSELLHAVSTPTSPFTFQSPKKATSPITPNGSSSTPLVDAHIILENFIPKELIGIAASVELKCDNYQIYCRTKNDRVSLLALARAILDGSRVRQGDCIYVPFKGLSLPCVVCHIVDVKDENQISFEEDTTERVQQQLNIALKDCVLDHADAGNYHSVFSMIDENLPGCNFPLVYEINQITSVIFVDINEEDREQQLTGYRELSGSRNFVAGLDNERQKITSALWPSLLTPSIFLKVNNGVLRPPKGVLLFGPSGVGKTALAKEICFELSKIYSKDYSKEVNEVVFKWVECGTLISSVVGHSERQLSKMFNSAEEQAIEGVSTLIVLDNIELLCPRRGGPIASASTDRSAATLLALLDGIGSTNTSFASSSNIISHQVRGNIAILAITSRPSALDPALRRPGRLDYEVELGIPDETNRAKIIRKQIQELIHEDHVPGLSSSVLKALSRKAKGFTGADTLLAIKDAMRHALLDDDLVCDNFNVKLEFIEHSISRTNPSSIRDIVVEVPTVKWDDIGGMHDVKALLKETIEFPVIYAHLYKALNIRSTKGVLLYGPPGCSKTLMARALATEGQMNFLAVKGPELLSKWLGESERALASLFRRARQAAPSVIFFDEIDAIASKRGSADGGSSGDRLLSQLLTELDGISPLKRVVVVGATNRPDLLDNALTRPGRIDRKVYVGIPDYESRQGILRIGLKGKACCDDLDVSELAQECYTGGYSGAEIISLCREAALHAIEDDEKIGIGNPVIAMRHMLKSISETKRQITPKILKFYADLNP